MGREPPVLDQRCAGGFRRRYPLDTCLREAREAGYQGIELGRKFPRQAETLGPLLAAADLRLASGWYSGLLAERSVEAELEAVRSTRSSSGSSARG